MITKRPGVFLPHCGNKTRGSALVMAVVFTAIMTIAAVFAYRSTIFQTRMAARSQDYLVALSLAEAGAELAMVQLNQPASATPPAFTGWAGGGTKTLNDELKDHEGVKVGDFEVSVSDITGDNPLIVATGYVPSKANPVVKRTVQIVAENDTVPSPFGSFGIFGFDGVTMNGSQVVDSYNAETGKNGTKNATIGSWGDIKFGGSSVIRGSVQAGGTVKAPGASVITGEVVEKSKPTPPPPLPEPEYDPEPPANDNNNQIQWKDMFGNLKNVPSNGNINASGVGSLVLPAPGVYYLNNVSFSGSHTVSIVGNGDVKIYASSSFDVSGANSVAIQGNANVTLISPKVDFQGAGTFELANGADLTVIANTIKLAGGKSMELGPESTATFFVNEGLTINGASSLNANGKPSQLRIFAKKNNITFNGSSVYNGGIYAPEANLTINGAAKWSGAIVAKSVTVNGASSVTTEESILAPESGDGVFVNAWVEISPK